MALHPGTNHSRGPGDVRVPRPVVNEQRFKKKQKKGTGTITPFLSANEQLSIVQNLIRNSFTGTAPTLKKQ